MAVHGRPRATEDLDVLVSATPEIRLQSSRRLRSSVRRSGLTVSMRTRSTTKARLTVSVESLCASRCSPRSARSAECRSRKLPARLFMPRSPRRPTARARSGLAPPRLARLHPNLPPPAGTPPIRPGSRAEHGWLRLRQPRRLDRPCARAARGRLPPPPSRPLRRIGNAHRAARERGQGRSAGHCTRWAQHGRCRIHDFTIASLSVAV